jgi:hypothetical protein
MDYQPSIRQFCRSPCIETGIVLSFVGIAAVNASRCHGSSYACNRRLEPAFAAKEFSPMYSGDGATACRLGASAGRGTGFHAPSRKRLGHPASVPRAIMGRSPEALAFGSRRHFIPASLSLPLCGCRLDRSRDCSRSRVPPRFPRRRYADAPAAASFSCLRLASARFRQSPLGSEMGS